MKQNISSEPTKRKDFCWACGRLVETYQHKAQNVLGKTVTETLFKKHSVPALRRYAKRGYKVTSIYCPKSNSFAK